MPADSLPIPASGAAADGFVDGPAGRLEALLAEPKSAPVGLCVICHPHPLFGGSMTNKVVWALASAAGKAGLRSLRFNFRGVGRSDGRFDDAIGETDDALAAAAALQATAPALPLVLAGFSFGGHVALRAASRRPAVALITVAPPMGRYLKHAEPPPQPPMPWLAVHSADDEVVAFTETEAALMAYPSPPTFVRFDGAGHFFHGRLGELERSVLAFLQPLFAAG